MIYCKKLFTALRIYYSHKHMISQLSRMLMYYIVGLCISWDVVTSFPFSKFSPLEACSGRRGPARETTRGLASSAGTKAKFSHSEAGPGEVLLAPAFLNAPLSYPTSMIGSQVGDQMSLKYKNSSKVRFE